MAYQYVGQVTHFFDRISVAVIALEDEIYVGEWLLFDKSGVEQQIASLQIDHNAVETGMPGDQIAVKVDAPVRQGDDVYLILADE